MPGPPTPDALRAAKLSRVPGVTVAEAAGRFGISAAAVTRARKNAATAPSLQELALAALTRNGTQAEGALDREALVAIAGWIDYINHDGCTAEHARALIGQCSELALAGDRWTLVAPWP